MTKVFKYLNYLLLVLLLATIAFAFARYIQLPTADLGRHIANGHFIIKAFLWDKDLEQYSAMFHNFYSYTERGFELVNHHWLSGVFYYWIHKFSGFQGLTILNILCALFGFLFYFLTARQLSSSSHALFFSVIVLPALIWRLEVRPEIFSNLLIGLYFYLFAMHRDGKIKFQDLLAWIIVLQLLWVNLHILFVIGLAIIAFFFLESVFVRREHSKDLFIIGSVATIVSLINPAGLKGLLEPLGIFEEYGYMLIENQSVFFMIKRFPGHLIHYLALLYVLLLIISFVYKFRSYTSFSEALKNNLVHIFLSLAFTIVALNTNRIIPNLAFITIPVLACNFSGIKIQSRKMIYLLYVVALSFVSYNLYLRFSHSMMGLGTLDRVHASAKFVKDNNISGPIFNNYDIGGYLIYHLYPTAKVFVDNRPEAYPKAFFDEQYLPMQKDEAKWKELDDKYGFNMIFYFRHDMTEHGQPFLIRRLKDPLWAPVFVDSWNIVLLKRNQQNKELIDRFELPPQIFKVVKH